MSEVRVASRYAKSLLELAEEKGILDEVHDDMMRLLQVQKSNPEFTAVIKSPVIHSDKKLKILKAIFSATANELTLSFFDIVSRKGREGVLPVVAKEFHKQFNLYKGIQSAEVVTTFPITDDQRNKFTEIVKEISGKDKVELMEKVDKELIGGFILRIEDRQLDESLSSKLKMLHLDFTQNLYEKKY